MAEAQKNWAGNLTYSTTNIAYPDSLAAVQELVKNSSKLRVLGSRHSFNHIADSNHLLVSLKELNRVVAIDRERQTVTVEAGIRYGDMCAYLNSEGFAVHNMASLPHISVIGACSTATHGSGDKNGNLATAVSALEFVTADGEVVQLSRDKDGEQFKGAVVGLGGIGVVTKVTLDLLPRFEIRQDVYLGVPLAQVEAHFDEITASAYSVSMFTDWQGEHVNQLWLKSRVDAETPFDAQTELFGAKAAPKRYHPIESVSAESCTEQTGIVGAWHERLPHFRMEFTPSHGEELQAEYFVARKDAVAAFKAIHALRDQIAPYLMISEIRTIAADDLWMSPNYQQDSVAFHFTWKPDWASVREVLPHIEAALAPYNARPHWGKLFTMPAAHLQSLYAKLPDFRQLLMHYDPHGKFRNAFLDEYIFG